MLVLAFYRSNTIPMKFKFIRHIEKTSICKTISRTKVLLFSVTSFFITFGVLSVFTYAKAQSVSYTEPSLDDLRLANKAVSSCRVLQDVISENSQVEDIPAIEAFIELQRTEDGNLLIDNEACRDSILEFVKNLCTSSSSKNNLYCESLGIQKSESISDDRINDANYYKKFGQSAIDNLGIDLSDDISFESSLDEKDQQEESKLKFLAAGTLFSLSPVRKLKLIPLAGRAATTRIKPVLSGALLVLATLGLSSCNDATGPEPVKPPPIPETPCTRRESGYFQLSGANGACIKLPTLTYSFLTSTGEESDSSNGDPDTTIKLKFDSEVVFIDSSGFRALTPENVLQMLEIKKNNEADLTTSEGSITQENISITQESSNTVITISPPDETNYEPGDYRIITSNYAKAQDASKISTSSSSSYLNAIKKESSFRVDTPCVRDIEGYFQLEGTNSACIKLPTLTYSFLTSTGEESDSSNGDPDTSIKITFDSEVVFIDSSGFRALTPEHVLQMLEIKKNNEADLTTSEGSINQDNISITEESSNTVITIKPPNGSNGKIYHAGEYSILTKNYAPKTDASKVQQSTNVDAYIAAITKESSFNVIGNSPCTRAERGYFYFRDANNTARCENLIPNVSYTFSSSGDPQATLEINFDSDIVFIDNNGWSEIDDNNILDILSINPVDTNTDYTINTDDLLVEDGPIDQDQITVTKTNSNITIEIDPPNTGLNPHGRHQVGLYQAGDYVISASNYIKRSSVDIVTRHNILESYLETVKSNSKKGFSIDAVASLACGAEASQGYMTTIPIDGEDHQKQSFCGAYVHKLPPELATAAHHHYQPRRADPDTTYVIDIGFVLSENHSSDDWKDFIADEIIPSVNDIYQRSGVNVEFRPVAMVYYQDYKHYMHLCQLDRLDSNSRAATGSVRFNLVPIMRRDYGADLIYSIQNYAKRTNICGSAPVRRIGGTLEWLKRYVSTGEVDPLCGEGGSSSMSNPQHHFEFIETLAHEIGHNLGLHHNKEALPTFPVKYALPNSYGYRSEANTVDGQTFSYGTIMSLGVSPIPFFSANRSVTKEELCIDEDRHDNQLDRGFCTGWYYDSLTDEQLRLGDEQADAVEALQYTIEDASRYHCSPGSC